MSRGVPLRPSQRIQIESLRSQGKTPKEIAQELGINASTVRTVIQTLPLRRELQLPEDSRLVVAADWIKDARAMRDRITEECVSLIDAYRPAAHGSEGIDPKPAAASVMLSSMKLLTSMYGLNAPAVAIQQNFAIENKAGVQIEFVGHDTDDAAEPAASTEEN